MSKKATSLLFFSPRIVAFFVFLAGIINILSALLAESWLLHLLEELIPLEVFDASRTLTVISGIFLIVVAWGLWLRKHRAWVLSITLIITSLIFHVFRGPNAVEIVSLLIPLFLLIFFRDQFHIKSTPWKPVTRVSLLIGILVILLAYLFGGLFLLRGQFAQPVSVGLLLDNYKFLLVGLGEDPLIAQTSHALWFENSLFLVNLLFIFIACVELFAPLIQHITLSEEDTKRIQHLIHHHGFCSTSYFAHLPDKKHHLSPEKDSLISYKVKMNTAVVLGEPFVEPLHYLQAIQQFTAQMMECGLSTAFYLVRERSMSYFQRLGFSLLKIGEEAIIYPDKFSLAGSDMKKIRNSVSYIQKEGIVFELYSLGHVPWNIQEQVDHLYHQWLAQRSFPPLSFSMNFYPLPHEVAGYLVVAKNPDGTLETALSFLPYNQNKNLTLDLMLRNYPAHNGVVEATIAQSLTWFKERQIQEVSLGMVTLADTHPDDVSPQLVQVGRKLLFKYFNQFYNYQSLFAFKDKFHPSWQPRYVAYTNQTELMRTALAIIEVHTTPKVLHRLWKK
jgi:phosphatidylglycerol lysyltransferase